MKKLNKFALGMWIAAVLVAVTNLFSIYFAIQSMRMPGTEQIAPILIRNLLLAAVGTITPVAALTGLGALIEIADQIRIRLQQQS